MIQELTHITIVVEDQDEAKEFYRDKFGFEIRRQELQNNTPWITVAPQNSTVEIVLQHPSWANTEQEQRRLAEKIGNSGEIVYAVEDCHALYEEFTNRGVEIIQQPQSTEWGIELIVADLYGNPFVFDELTHDSPSEVNNH